MIWFGKCDFMSMKQKLEDISTAKLRVSILKNDYDCYIAQAEKMKELGLSVTSEKCSNGAESAYQEIQEELNDYKRVIAAVKMVEGLEGVVLKLHYLEGKSIQNISDITGYSTDYLREIRNSAIKTVEKIYTKTEGEK